MVWIVALAVVAGVLALDDRAGWQGLLAHPVFASVLVGSILGEPDAALSAGLPLELIYLSIVPMRGGKTSDRVAAGVVGAGTAGLLARSGTRADPVFVGAMAVFVGLAAGEVGARLTGPAFKLHNRFLGALEFAPEMDRRRVARRLTLIHLGSIGFIFLVEALTVLLLAAGGYYTASMATRSAESAMIRGAEYWSLLVTAIGAAAVIHLFWQHRFRRWLAVSAIAVVIILWIA
jgi:mannose/fructose/N-acetylgalactosamine-specific phosphotransferase system component IIC